jgi:cytochrome c-type biogenesis protein CcmH/NrfF
MMGKYIYSFMKFGVLQRSIGLPMTDSCGNYIAGEPHFVWWWPINWVVIGCYFLIFGPRFFWLAWKSRNHNEPDQP